MSEKKYLQKSTRVVQGSFFFRRVNSRYKKTFISHRQTLKYLLLSVDFSLPLQLYPWTRSEEVNVFADDDRQCAVRAVFPLLFIYSRLSKLRWDPGDMFILCSRPITDKHSSMFPSDWLLTQLWKNAFVASLCSPSLLSFDFYYFFLLQPPHFDPVSISPGRAAASPSMKDS